MLIFKLIISAAIPIHTISGYSFSVYNYETKLQTEYSLNHILAIFTNFHWIYIYDLLFKSSDYYSINMLKIMRIHHIKYSNILIMKILIKKKPILFFINIFSLTVTMFTFLIRLCELSLAIEEDDLGFESFMITLWMVIVTLTTVGYGDYSPKTIPGRFFGFILCIWGIVEISIIVVVLFEQLLLNYSESQALYLFNKLEKRKKLRSQAIRSNFKFF